MEEDQIILYWETDRRFWDRTHYKRGKRLDMSVQKDREMAKIWLQIFAEVRAIRDRATREAQAISSKNKTPYVVSYQLDTGAWNAMPLKNREDLDAAYKRGVEAPEMFSYVATYDFTKNRRSPVDDHFASMGPPPRQNVGWSAISGDTRGGGFVEAAKTVGVFAVLLSAGWFLSKKKERKELEEEKAAFRRLGFDWNQRARY